MIELEGNNRVGLAVIFLIFVFGLTSFPGHGGEVYSSSEKVDPLLGYLVKRNSELKELGERGLDLGQYSGSLEVYDGEALEGVSTTIPESQSREVKTKTIGLEFRGETGLGVIVKFDRPVTTIANPSIKLMTAVGKIATGIGSLEEISQLIADERVVFVAPSKPLRPLLDESLPLVGADDLHAVEPVDRGEGTLIGIVDSGIDYDHRDFRVDREGSVPGEETSRISFIWDQTDDFSSPPSGYVYGSEYSNYEIEQDIRTGDGPSSGTVRVNDLVGHGTHVTGIAAGDGSSSSGGYVGMAPASSIVAVKTNFSTSSVIDGVSYIADRASQLGVSGVITNLSLGTQFGPHDGTSLFESALNELVTKDHLITVSAGNSGDERIHIGESFTAGDQKSFTFFIPGYTPSSETADYVSLDGYYGASGNLEVRVVGPGGERTPGIRRGEAGSFALSGGSVLISNGPSTLSGDNEVYIRIGDLDGASPPASGDWQVEVTGIYGARLDMWVAENLLGGDFRLIEFEEGDTDMTIAEPGNAEDLLTVGSFNSKNSWDGYSIGGFPIGNLSRYSSRGPTRDGRLKPDLIAPGAWVVSSLSGSAQVENYLTVADGKHWALAGTSMAAPHVAGAAALIWRASPEFSATEVARLLTETARAEGRITPDNSWGWGKLDAKAGVYGAGMPVGKTEKELWIRATPNPAEEYVDFFFNYPDNPEKLKVEIYNVLGKRVRVIGAEKLTGELKYRWELTDDKGVSLANGLYIYLIRTSNLRSDLSRLVIRR